MAILNKRNAVLGWGVWKVGKRVARKKAREAIPGRADETKRRKGAIVSTVAAVGGALWFWRRRRGGDEA